MEELNDKDRRMAERFIEAERLEKESRPDEKKRKWIKTRCPKCGYKIEYVPKEKWDGELRCPHCGESFKISRLDDWTEGGEK